MQYEFTGTVPDGFRVGLCGPDRAEAAMAMRDAILAEIADTTPSWYIIDETDDEFRAFFTLPECVAIGIDAPNGDLAAIGVGSFREAELERFRAYIPVEEFSKPRNVGYVELIQVASGYRGLGFQRLLFTEIERVLRDKGARWLTGIVSPDNKYSLANFQRMGYRRVGDFIHARTGFARLNMIKDTAAQK